MKKHSNSNGDCPLNDPETYCNPVVAGLDCTCEESHNITEKIKEMAAQIAPDYPNILTVEPWEQLWAIRSSYEGTCLANGDCHKLINKLREKLGWTMTELVDFWQANR